MVDDDASVSASDLRRDRYVLPAILLLAVILRGLVIWFRSDQLSIDRDAYLGIAQSLVEGRGFCSPGSSSPTAFRPPLYPLLISLRLPLSADQNSIVAQRISVAWWNIIAGLLTVVCVERLGRSLNLGRWRYLAALLAAVDPLLLYATSQPMTEVVFTGLVTASLWSMIRSQPPGWSLRRSFGTGVLFGLAALTRPTIWPLAGLLALAIFLVPVPPQWRKHRRAGIGAMVLGTLLIVAPWVIRNVQVFGRPILMTTHGGYTLLLANNPVYQREVVEQPWGTVWSGESLDRWQKEVEQRLQADLGAHPTEWQRDAWMSAEANRWIRQEPFQFVRAAVHRVRCLWNVTPQGEGTSLPLAVRSSVGAFFTVEYLLAICGLILLVRRREWPAWLPAILLIATLQEVHLVYWTDTRMRAPLQPVLALLAARALMELAKPQLTQRQQAASAST